jgi:hypothetical protein
MNTFLGYKGNGPRGGFNNDQGGTIGSTLAPLTFVSVYDYLVEAVEDPRCHLISPNVY